MGSLLLFASTTHVPSTGILPNLTGPQEFRKNQRSHIVPHTWICSLGELCRKAQSDSGGQAEPRACISSRLLPAASASLRKTRRSEMLLQPCPTRIHSSQCGLKTFSARGVPASEHPLLLTSEMRVVRCLFLLCLDIHLFMAPFSESRSYKKRWHHPRDNLWEVHKPDSHSHPTPELNPVG